ncbi:O-antigen ligase family protein [Pedobacter jejuensis]|uniref:O-antigen ligase domain-containing protein n=1 Tax=Pedobacter jejuensis TaxID=1268550 RepID=A0A3N0BV92_9SPHI|nr:O-antigen ligase family protein [Pedobacter jejuensis]RNL53027.1 O-antigen ligase domain-containing protein [Pedobacter jejuensis]
MENTFSWLVMPISNIVLMYEKILSLVIFGFVLYKFNNLKFNEKIYIGLLSVVIVKMIFESMLDYGTIFQQLTLFTILFPVAFTIFIKYICREYNFDILELIAQFYILLYIVFMLIYGRTFSFSLEQVEMVDYGPFSGDSRIIHARSIFMMIVPLLWYFNQFLKYGKITNLLPFLFCITVIVIHQHRSVWASSIFSMCVYFFMSLRNNLTPISRVVKTFLSGLLLIALVAFVVSQAFPGTLEFFSDRFSEILDPAKEDGTGKFRADQRQIYFPMVLERPFFGWTFEGFEMKNPLVDWWPEKTGQHFHEGFMEMLFYHGFFGLILKYFYLVYLAYKSFSKNLDQKSIILIAFSLAGLIFSFSYVLPLIFWGMVGLCLYYLETRPENEESEEPEHIIITQQPSAEQIKLH